MNPIDVNMIFKKEGIMHNSIVNEKSEKLDKFC